MSFRRASQHPPAHPDIHRHRFVVPLTSAGLFNQIDTSMLPGLGLTQLWVMEYALAMWHPLSPAWFNDDVYGTVCDDVIAEICVGNDNPNDLRLQRFLAENVDWFMTMLMRVRAQFAIYRSTMPDQIPSGLFESVTLVHEDTPNGFSILSINVHKRS